MVSQQTVVKLLPRATKLKLWHQNQLKCGYALLWLANSLANSLVNSLANSLLLTLLSCRFPHLMANKKICDLQNNLLNNILLMLEKLSTI
jgi:hypothetical protein